MKHIVLDCLRRWAWLYLLGFIVAVGLNIPASFFPPFGVFTPYFLAPWLGPLFVLGFDMMRGSAGVMVALPVSTRHAGIGYWIVGVCVPPVLLTLALVVAGIIAWPLNAPATLGIGQLALTVVISFLICGCTFFVLTLLRTGPQEGFWNNVTAAIGGALWGLSAFSGMAVKFLLDSRNVNAVTLGTVAFAALVFTILGFLRCGDVVRWRARNRFTRQFAVRERTPARLAATSAGVSGLPYLFREHIRFSLGMALALALFATPLLHFLSGNSTFVEFMLVVCALVPALRYLPGLRQLRALPISVNGLALILFLLPLLSFSLCLGAVLLAGTTTGLVQITQTPAAWLLAGGVASLCNALAVRFGLKSMPLLFIFSMMILMLPMAFLKNLPLAAHVAFSGVLMIAAFLTLRLSLQSARLYRLPPALCHV